eukprot:3631102-Amphidinium_carterae.1
MRRFKENASDQGALPLNKLWLHVTTTMIARKLSLGPQRKFERADFFSNQCEGGGGSESKVIGFRGLG